MVEKISVGNSDIYNEDAIELYDKWDKPTVIISDGAYGVGGFESDPEDPDQLKEWYRPHVKKWSENATPETTLWFWCTERGWAEVHSLIEDYNWEYRGANIWDKGIQHVAGNSNTKRLRKFPQVTEMCVQYVKKPVFDVNGCESTMQDWLRHEWDRTGLNLYEANDACGVAEAASRKYLTKDDEWYFPPPEAFENLSTYANKNGEENGKPYFSIDGDVLTKEEWKKMRAKFECPTGVTNVWNEPPLHTEERHKIDGSYLHLNQKPIKLIERLISVSSDEEDIVWAPFGGLCTSAVVSNRINRKCLCAEIVDRYYEVASKRLKQDQD